MDVERQNDMIELRRSGESLQAIGDIYGITRERVRQILSKTDAHPQIFCVGCGRLLENVKTKKWCHDCTHCRVCGRKTIPKFWGDPCYHATHHPDYSLIGRDTTRKVETGIFRRWNPNKGGWVGKPWTVLNGKYIQKNTVEEVRALRKAHGISGDGRTNRAA